MEELKQHTLKGKHVGNYSHNNNCTGCLSILTGKIPLPIKFKRLQKV